MNFENCEAFVIPFSVQKTSVWKEVIRYLCEKETTPVEAICNSRIVSIDKEYYPVERTEIIYTAKWNAISVFKEYWTEQETHYEKEIHYFDRFGGEHKHAGFDYYDAKSGKWRSGTFNPIASRVKGYSGDASARPWEPKEVTVTVTEDIPCERETGRQKNSGSIKGNYLYQHSKGYPFFHSLFSNLTGNEKIPYSKESVKDGTVMNQPYSFSEKDFNSVLSKAKSDAESQCIRKIPGQAYAGFHMEFDSDEVFQIWYYPVYHIIYEFKEEKYECFVSGCQEGHVYEEHHPEDASIESIKQQYDDHCSELKGKKKKCWLKFVWIWLGVCAVDAVIFPFFGLFIFSLGNIGTIVASVLPIMFIGIAIYLCWENYKEIKNIKNEIAKNKEAKDNVVPIRQAKKKAIMEIILNDDLSDSEKKVKCEAILNN